MTKPGELSTEEAATKAAKFTPEQAAILASATAAESTLASAVPPHDEEGNLVEQEPVVDHLAGNTALLNFLLAAATPVMPFLPQCYTPEVIDQIAGAFTAVEEKYGWDIGSSVGPEVALAIATIPPTLGAVVLGKQYFAEKRAAREAAERNKAAGRPEQAIGDATKGAIGA